MPRRVAKTSANWSSPHVRLPDGAKRPKCFLDHASLVADTDGIDSSAHVLLMTLHNSKGLEFPAVFLVGMEEQLLPHVRSLEPPDNDALEEERRLCYVGMTRARRFLSLSCAAQRGRYGAGSEVPMLPSRFLDEIPQGLINDVARRSMGIDQGHIYEGASHGIAPQPISSSRLSQSTLEDSGFETHNSVEAIKGFFKQRAGSGDDGTASDTPAPEPAVKTPSVPTGAAPLEHRNTPRPVEIVGEFTRGAKVRHRRFGVGVVQHCQGQGERAKLSVYFHEYGLKKLIAGPAKLQAL